MIDVFYQRKKDLEDFITGIMITQPNSWLGFRHPLFFGSCKVDFFCDASSNIIEIRARIKIWGNISVINNLQNNDIDFLYLA